MSFSLGKSNFPIGKRTISTVLAACPQGKQTIHAVLEALVGGKLSFPRGLQTSLLYR